MISIERRLSASKRLDNEAAASAAEQAKALGDPTRLTIAHALSEAGELCVCDLSWVMERAENLVSHHVRLLRRAGLARSRRDGKMVVYSLTPQGHSLLAAATATAEALA